MTDEEFQQPNEAAAQDTPPYPVAGVPTPGTAIPLPPVGAQTPEFARKYVEVGCQPEAVHMLGNLKFDTAGVKTGTGPDVAEMLARLGVPPGASVLVGGSTHAGEEDLLAGIYQRLKPRFPDLFLILVPRHFERGPVLRGQLEKRGLRLAVRSEVGPDTRHAPGSLDCLLVNTTGELMSFYQAATLVFVGKSLTAQGGQNPIEPAALGKPTLFGPNMGNFRDVVRIFLARDAAVQVRDAADLEQTLAALLADPARRARLGLAASEVVRENRGAVARTVDMMVEPLRARGLYVAP